MTESCKMLTAIGWLEVNNIPPTAPSNTVEYLRPNSSTEFDSYRRETDGEPKHHKAFTNFHFQFSRFPTDIIYNQPSPPSYSRVARHVVPQVDLVHGPRSNDDERRQPKRYSSPGPSNMGGGRQRCDGDSTLPLSDQPTIERQAGRQKVWLQSSGYLPRPSAVPQQLQSYIARCKGRSVGTHGKWHSLTGTGNQRSNEAKRMARGTTPYRGQTATVE